MTGWTYGCELEWPDVPCTAALPDGWDWSSTDYTIVNSDGVANDPKRQLVLYGGELNTSPYASPTELTEAVATQWRRMRPGHNYRSNLHIHVRIPFLEEEPDLVKQVADFTRRSLPAALEVLDPLDGLLHGLSAPAEVKAARARLTHSTRSRHYFIPENRHIARASASGVEAMLAAEVPQARGRPAWALAPREAVNLRSLRKHGTIEFRCFAAPQTPEHVGAAAAFARDWLQAALTGDDPWQPVKRWTPELPRQASFVHALELGWQETNFKHHSRAAVAALLAERGRQCPE